MTNTDDLTIKMLATNERRLAQIEADRIAYANPIMPPIVRRPPPKTRRNSVKHRAIR